MTTAQTTPETKELWTISKLRGETKNILSCRKVLFDLMLERQCREYSNEDLYSIRKFNSKLKKETLDNRIFSLKRIEENARNKMIFIVGSNVSHSPYSFYFEPIIWYENEDICIIGDAYEEVQNIVPEIQKLNPMQLEKYLKEKGLS